MKKIHNITFPRSGHRVLGRVLKRYLKDKVKYHEVYGGSKYTEKEANYIKDHDFALKVVPSKNRVYLVQIRYPLESIISLFRLEKGGKDRREWELFAINRLKFWMGFYKKWVINPIGSPRYVLNYEDLITNPYKKSEEILRFIDEEVNPKLLLDVVNKAKIEKKHHMKDFVLYNDSFFNTLREKIKDVPGIDVTKDTLTI